MDTAIVSEFEEATAQSLTRDGGTASAFFAMLAQRVGPYLLIEAVLPGGTLIALLLYLYRARRTS